MSGAPADAGEMDLLLQLWEWERGLEYPAIRAALEPMPRSALLAVEEFALQLLYAFIYLKDTIAAAALAAEMEPRFSPGRNDGRARRFLNARGQIALTRGELTASQRLVEELRDQAEQADDASQLFHATVHLGIIAGLRGDFTASVREYFRALASSGTVDAGIWTPVLHHNLAISFRELGFIAEAERHFEQSRRSLPADWMTAISDLDRALLRAMLGDFDTAEGLARRGMATFDRIGAQNGVAEGHLVLARIALARGDLDEAEAQLARSKALLDPAETLVMAQVHEERAALALLRGDDAARAEAERAADALYRGMEAPWRAERMRTRLEVLHVARTAPADSDARAEYWISTPGL